MGSLKKQRSTSARSSIAHRSISPLTKSSIAFFSTKETTKEHAPPPISTSPSSKKEAIPTRSESSKTNSARGARLSPSALHRDARRPWSDPHPKPRRSKKSSASRWSRSSKGPLRRQKISSSKRKSRSKKRLPQPLKSRA